MPPWWAPAWWVEGQEEEARWWVVLEEEGEEEERRGSEERTAAWLRTTSRKLEVKVYPAWAKLPAWDCPPRACDQNQDSWLDGTFWPVCLFNGEEVRGKRKTEGGEARQEITNWADVRGEREEQCVRTGGKCFVRQAEGRSRSTAELWWTESTWTPHLSSCKTSDWA